MSSTQPPMTPNPGQPHVPGQPVEIPTREVPEYAPGEQPIHRPVPEQPIHTPIPPATPEVIPE
ncbi:hypothetical protein [Pendulispora albinea]|uniref:Uncharacterized protein n=1 Tax=Pendulispora albinea TaxID=2741071 RepID=A0ABZ2LS55_9BACT